MDPGGEGGGITMPEEVQRASGGVGWTLFGGGVSVRADDQSRICGGVRSRVV